MRLKLARVAAGLAAAAAAWISAMPIAAADPVWPVPGAESASATIADLEAQGYQVQLNGAMDSIWTDLSRCSVTAIHNPDRSPGTDKASITVYVDVSCPPEHRHGSGGFGIGAGLGF